MFELKFRRQRSEVTGGRSEERIRMEKVLLCTIAASALCAASSIRYRQYHFIYDPKNWTEAQTYCRQTYTDLVTVDSYSTVTTLNSLADVTQMGSTKHAWIGLYFDVIDWKWSLSDEDFYKNNEATYTNWYPGQPNGIWYTEQCVYMNLAYALWSDNYCNTLFHSVCSNVSGEKWNQVRFNKVDSTLFLCRRIGGNVTFVLNSNLMNWTDAQRYCRQHYTDLASVRNLSENAQIRKQITAPAWIGLYKSTWKWSNGPFFMYNYWQVLEPDGGDEKCTAANFANSGRWMDLACGLEKPFVCYHDPVPLWRTGIKLKLVKTSALRLEDPAVQEDLLQQFYVSAKTEADEPKRDRRRGTELEEATQQRRLLPRQDQQKLGSRFLVFVQIFFCS
ncbi:C-type mannose receptor 2-like [Nothobranchius furzeri]|uniref:C-type mannose receptor 2-like n=1 Tax=Nothobranchius furzeri TaxID=105023 RepID=A0A9D2XYS3_NOTFU|nr:C-type mannose receptor 2-like [Nothobranchius furzeri]